MADNRPGKPYARDQTSSTVTLHWDVLETNSEISTFEVKYLREGEKKWRGLETDGTSNDLQVTGLKSNSSYFFKVRIVYEDGDESRFSETSDKIETMGSLAERVITNSEKMASEECPYLYKVPLISEDKQSSDLQIRKCTVLTAKKDITKPEKTVMVVGQTGAGKSTLIDGMVNYILDVAWEEDIRFKLIDLTEGEFEKRQDQSVSQTEWITSYSLNWLPGCLVDYHLNIIDTPGFGDTRGIDRDKRLVEQIRTLFSSPGSKGIDTLDAVWFVTQAPMCRLSPTQQYIFDSILSLFGKDIGSNIFVLITFADGKRPPALDALKEANVPFVKDFVFNNSALFVDSKDNPTGQIFWKMGKRSFEEFFKVIRQTQPQSLTLTKDVLKTRKELEEKIAIVQNQIALGMQHMSCMREEQEQLEKNQRYIADSEDFTYEVSEEQAVHTDLPPGQHTTTCLTCNRTCHENCAIPDNEGKAGCVAMDRNGYCTVCPMKCIWSDHRNLPYLIHLETKKILKTYSQTKMKYVSAQKDKNKNINVIEEIREKYNTLMEENEALVQKVKTLINKLQEIALRPNTISEIQYIDILIENENEGKKQGYKERVKILEELRQKAEHIRDIGEDKFSFKDKSSN